MQRIPIHPLETLLRGAGVALVRPFLPREWLAAQPAGTLERLWSESSDARALVGLSGPSTDPRALLALACVAARTVAASIQADGLAALEAAEDWTRGAGSVERLEERRDALRSRHDLAGSWELGVQDGGPSPWPAHRQEAAWLATNAASFALEAALWGSRPVVEPVTSLVTQVQEAVHWSQRAAEATAVAAQLAADSTLQGRSRRSARQRTDKVAARVHAVTARRVADLVRAHLACPAAAVLSR